MAEETLRLAIWQEAGADKRTDSNLFTNLASAFPSAQITVIHTDAEYDKLIVTEPFLDLVVVDFVSLNGSGPAVTSALSAKVSARFPILGILVDHAQIRDFIRSGVNDYLVIGEVNPEIFKKSVMTILDRTRMKKELDVMTSELKAVNDQLERLANVDPLTGLLNRRGVHETLMRLSRGTPGSQQGLFALLFDIDDFKKVNDQLGHAGGDVILKEIALKIRASLRHTDVIARIGGDEFLVLMPQTRLTEGIHVAEKLRLALKNTIFSLVMKDAISLTASFGLMMVTDEVVNVDDLVARCHVALTKSKQQGKNRLSCDAAGQYESPLAAIMTALRSNDRYHVVKQPIFELTSPSRMIGYEFLSRLKVDGFQMPEDFFKICFENNMLTWVDYHCLKNCLKFSEPIQPKLSRHLNLFPSTMIDAGDEILSLFEKNDKGLEYVIEISEQQIIGDPLYLSKSVSAFKKQGLKIAIDDIGFGRSCLESWIVLEPDVIKIDKRWIQGIAKSEENSRALQRLMKVASALDTDVIAEGIEWPDDLEHLKKMGIRMGQGFLLGRPA